MIAEAIIRRKGLLGNVGKTVAHLMYPNDFELYVVAMELVQLRTGESLMYFVFPINPIFLSTDQTTRHTIIPTQGGTTLFQSSVHEPADFQMQGSFGRDFKLLIGDVYSPLISGNTSFKNTLQQFEKRLKTGYGCLKILEDIINQSDIVDNQGPRALIFYNFTFNQRYYVKVTNFKVTMEDRTNMIWNYSASIKLLGDVSVYRGEGESDSMAKRYAHTSVVQTLSNQLMGQLL